MEDAQGRKGILTKINTCFAHPIKFDLFTETSECSFCEMPIFGFVGHFEKTVHVLKWHNELGYGEMAAGHLEEHGPTTICEQCITSRVQVVYCPDPGHVIEPIDDSTAINDHDNAMDALIEAKTGSTEYFYQLQRWCSMCFSLASFKCCNEQPSLSGNSTEEVMQDGCGLRLCVSCETRLREEFEGETSALAAALDVEPKWREDDNERKDNPPRADVGFLVKDGLLMETFVKACGDSGEGDEGGQFEQGED